MSRLTESERKRLLKAVHDNDYLNRLVRQIERLHHVVFHGPTKNLDEKFIRASAEEILIADIVNRHEGKIDGVYYALRKIEDSGRSWDHAVSDYASYIHNYYTTPLGVVMCRDLFGENSHFVTPAAGKFAKAKPQPAVT